MRKLKQPFRFNPKSLANLDQTKHGMCGTRTWKSWASMIRRCRGSNDKAKWYADRGIRICERWDDFANFLADMGERPEGQSLDRIDNSGNYEPANCRWANTTTQMRNKRTNVRVTFNGETKCVSEWAASLGINRSTIEQRLAKKWSIEKVLSVHKFHEQKGRSRA